MECLSPALDDMPVGMFYLCYRVSLLMKSKSLIFIKLVNEKFFGMNKAGFDFLNCLTFNSYILVVRYLDMHGFSRDKKMAK